MEKTEKKSISRQFSYYLIAAGIGYVVDFGGLYVLHEVFSVHYLIAAAVSFTLGLVVVYLLSSLFVFSNSKIKSKSLEVGLFAVIGLVGLGILTILMWLFVGLFAINYLIAKIIATIVVYGWNFFARRALYNN